MAPDVARRIFEPFFTTRRGSGGTGLGMHIVYNVVTVALGGRITCSTQPGRGVSFAIEFPLVHPDVPPSDR
jgi:signal transduction histidine kinase